MGEQYALVLGSSQGLGFEITTYLLDEGYIVFGASRTETPINHINFIDIATDVKYEQSVEEMFEIISETTDKLDLIINSAGICQMGPIEEVSSNEFTEHFATNTLGAFHILKHLKDFLIENKTHIIHLLSEVINKGTPNLSAYTSSKHGLKGLIECCKKEWEELGIRFSNLLPGAINTSLWDNVGMDISRENMLQIDDFIHVLDMVIKSPNHLQFPEMSITHRNSKTD